MKKSVFVLSEVRDNMHNPIFVQLERVTYLWGQICTFLFLQVRHKSHYLFIASIQQNQITHQLNYLTQLIHCLTARSFKTFESFPDQNSEWDD